MSGTNDTRAVSDEDWHKAHEIICDVRDASARVPEDADSGDILDALIEHGWGPRLMVEPSVLGYVVVEWVQGKPNPNNGMTLQDRASALEQWRKQQRAAKRLRVGYRYTVHAVMAEEIEEGS